MKKSGKLKKTGMISAESTIDKVVLVGTYRKENADWIKEQIVAQTNATDEFIKSRILTIRGVQVILDRDLAMLYGVPAKRVNEQVKRNAERFPDDFMFRLTKEECLRSQIATLENLGTDPKNPLF